MATPSISLRLAPFWCVLLLCCTPLFATNAVDASRGADAAVDYAALARIGPWDDRNYQLTPADIALLSPDEASADDLIPAFFRVELRRANPELPTTGPAQYPRSAFQRFKNKYYGYLINGRLYRELRLDANGDFEVVLKHGQTEKQYLKALLATEIRVNNPQHGDAESAIAINPANTQRVIAGTNGGTGQSMWYSSNGGTSWTKTPELTGTSICCDPTVAWSGTGAVAYSATLGDGVYVYRSTDFGQTWGTNVVVPTTNSNVDKEYLHVDTQPLSPHFEKVYICWHLSNVQKFSRSTDLGLTFSTPLTFTGNPTGIGCDITSDSGGNVYYFYPATSTRQIILKKSTDGGATFATPVVVASTQGSFDFPIPAMPVRRAFIYTSADVDLSQSSFRNTIYVAYTDSTALDVNGDPNANHARIQVAYSRDGGTQWTVRTPHATADANTVDRFHPWLKVDNNGRVHVVFYDTRNSGAGLRNGVDFFYSYSETGGDTWSAATRLTTLNMTPANDGFEWGDYNGMDMALTKALGIYTDRRDESDGSGVTVDAYAVDAFAVTGALDGLFGNGFE